MHLRSLNSYVEAALGDWGRMHSLGSHAPRAAGPSVRQGLAAGTSSFGMSGVNAHLLTSAGQQQPHAEPAEHSVLVWQRQRHWPVPPGHAALVAAVLSTRGSAAFEISISSPTLSFLRQSVVQGRSCLLGSFSIGIAAAACSTLHAAPVVLTAATLAPAHALADREAVACHISCSAGTVQLGTFTGAALLSASIHTSRSAQRQPSVTSAGSRPAWLPQLSSTAQPAHPQAIACLADSPAQLCAAQAALHLPYSRVVPASKLLAACAAAACCAEAPAAQRWAASSIHRTPGTTSVAGSAAVLCDQRASVHLAGCVAHALPQRSAAAAGESWQLYWQSVQPSSLPAPPANLKVLLLSSAPVSLASICQPADSVGCTALSVTYTAQRQPSLEASEIVVSSAAQLALLLSCVQADHAFCIQQPCSGEPYDPQLSSVCLLACSSGPMSAVQCCLPCMVLSLDTTHSWPAVCEFPSQQHRV